MISFLQSSIALSDRTFEKGEREREREREREKRAREQRERDRDRDRRRFLICNIRKE